jgi:hypothetical protein
MVLWCPQRTAVCGQRLHCRSTAAGRATSRATVPCCPQPLCYPSNQAPMTHVFLPWARSEHVAAAPVWGHAKAGQCQLLRVFAGTAGPPATHHGQPSFVLMNKARFTTQQQPPEDVQRQQRSEQRARPQVHGCATRSGHARVMMHIRCRGSGTTQQQGRGESHARFECLVGRSTQSGGIDTTWTARHGSLWACSAE